MCFYFILLLLIKEKNVINSNIGGISFNGIVFTPKRLPTEVLDSGIYLDYCRPAYDYKNSSGYLFIDSNKGSELGFVEVLKANKVPYIHYNTPKEFATSALWHNVKDIDLQSLYSNLNNPA